MKARAGRRRKRKRVMSEEKQGEFFSDSFGNETKRPYYFFRQDFLRRKKLTLSITYENLILVFIGSVMLFVICFSLGTEKGRRTALHQYKRPIIKKNGAELRKREMKTEAEGWAEEGRDINVYREYAEKVSIESKEKKSQESETGDGQAEAKEKEPIASKPYTIQVVAFKRKDNAEDEAGKLKGEGYDTFTLPSKSGQWIQVCVGRFVSKKESEGMLEELSKRYPGSYVRKVVSDN